MRPPLRVLHLFGSYLPYTENWAYRLMEHLPQVEVQVGAKYFTKCKFYSPRFTYHEFPIQTIDHQTRRLWVRLFNKAARMARELYPGYLRRVVGPVDLVHSHFAVVGWQYLELAKQLRVPHVVSFYGADYESIPCTQPLWRPRYQELFRRADLFLCEGEYGARALRTLGCPAGKVHVARLGVELENVPFHKRLKQPGELSLVQVAAFAEKKGQTFTAQAFLQCVGRCPNMTLTFVGPDRAGGGANASTIRSMLQGTAAEGKVRFLDHVDFAHLYSFLQQYQVFVHPSCYSSTRDCEGGAPVVLLDAQATGMPIIATTHCDIPEEVVHGKTGLLSSEKDVGGLASSIERFYGMDGTEYEGFSREARLHVECQYDVRTNSAKVRELYQRLVDGQLVM